MKYYSEDDVMDLIREAEDCERAYEWGEGHRRIHFEDYHPIEIPDKHGRLIDADALIEKTRMWSLVRGDEYFELRVNNAIVKELLEAVPTIVEASK